MEIGGQLIKKTKDTNQVRSGREKEVIKSKEFFKWKDFSRIKCVLIRFENIRLRVQSTRSYALRIQALGFCMYTITMPEAPWFICSKIQEIRFKH